MSMFREVRIVRIIVNHEKCCGAGQCVLVAPDVFDQRDEDGVVVLLDETPDESQNVQVHQAAAACPARAIAIEDGTTT
jgi:ferredoxin